MNVALLAARRVGFDIAAFLGRLDERPACLVLDAADQDTMNGKIIEALGVSASDTHVIDKNEIDRLGAILSSYQVDLGICVWWPYLLPTDVIGAARLGFLNLHPSFLPYNRGKNPNFWSIVEGTPAGVTIHWLDGGVDSGDIAFQSGLETTWEDTGHSLYEKAQKAIVELFVKHWREIGAGTAPRAAQADGNATVHRASEMDAASRIELSQSYRARDLLNLMRARTFSPYPAVRFQDGDREFEVRVEIKERPREQR